MANWRGVFPAVTTQFKADQSLDVPATLAQVERLLRAGVHGIIMLGSLGTAWVSIIAYYFGSSSGSDRKTELMAKASQG